MMQLTSLEPNTGGTRPILVNSEHVVSARPRTGSRPQGLSQNPATLAVSMGTEIALINGDRYTVKDPYDQIARYLVQQQESTAAAATPAPEAAPTPPAAPPQPVSQAPDAPEPPAAPSRPSASAKAPSRGEAKGEAKTEPGEDE